MHNSIFPLSRIFYLIIIRIIDLFSFRFFVIYSVIAFIFHLNVAGEYIDKII
jgi:hypothetical protein